MKNQITGNSRSDKNTIIRKQKRKEQVSNTKTEVITLKRSNNDSEGWRKIKKLGSLLGNKEGNRNKKKTRQNSLH